MPNFNSEKAEETKRLYDNWRSARSSWEAKAAESLDFYNGNHFTAQEILEIESINQTPAPMDRTYQNVELLKYMMTARPPKFIASPREDSDNNMALNWRIVMSYVWDGSEGNKQMRRIINDMSVYGVGYAYVYINHESDYGLGDVRFVRLDPFRVYTSPNDLDDIDTAIPRVISNIVTKEELIDKFPELETEIDEESGEPIIDRLAVYNTEEDRPPAPNFSITGIQTVDMAAGLDPQQKRYQILERVYPVKVPFYRAFDKNTGQSEVLNEQQLEIFQSENILQISSGDIIIRKTMQRRYKAIASIGDYEVYDIPIDSEFMSIIKFQNNDVDAIYGVSDIQRVMPLQKVLNNVYRIIIAHFQASAGLKLMIPENSVEDIDVLKREWANPTGVIAYNPDDGEPHTANPQQLSSEYINLIQKIEFYIDSTMGVSDILRGFSDAGQDTAKATEALSENAQGRPRAKLQQLEDSIIRLGKCMYNLAKSHYTLPKLFSILQPNNDLDEFTANFYPDKSEDIKEMKNEINNGFYDISIIPGSMLPTSRAQESAMHFQAFQLGLIDRYETLKKMEIYDIPGILKRSDEKAQLEQIVEQLQKTVKQLEADLGSSRKEVMHNRERAEIQRIKAELFKIAERFRSDKKINVSEISAKLDKLFSDAEREITATASEKKGEK